MHRAMLRALEMPSCSESFPEPPSDLPVTLLLDQLRPGDTLVVWKLDRLGRSLRHPVDTPPGGRLVFHVFTPGGSSNGI